MNSDPAASPVFVPYTFDQVLDDTCVRLRDTQVRYSLKRIGELEACLAAMEAELDSFLKAGGQ